MALTQISTDGIKNGTITGGDLATNVDLVDNQKIRFGNGNDLQIYHDGSHSRIYNSTGHISVRSAVFDVLNADGSERMMRATANAGCDLFFNGVSKLETRVGDTIFHDDIRIQDNNKINIGTGDDLQIYHSSGDAHITNSDGNLNIVNSTDGWIRLQPKSGEEGIIVKYDGAVELYHDNSKKFETTSSGATITGNLIATGNLNVNDNGNINVGNSGDLQLFHNGTNSFIDSDSGNLVISSVADLRFNSADYKFMNTADNETLARFIQNGAVELYHDNSKKFETTASGVQILSTGTGATLNIEQQQDADSEAIKIRQFGNQNQAATIISFLNWAGSEFGSIESAQGGAVSYTTNDNGKFIAGNGDDLQIFHDGNSSFITNTTGDLTLIDESRIKLRTDQFVVNNHANDENIIYAAADGEISLYHNGSKKFDTTSTGVTVTGQITQTSAGAQNSHKFGSANPFFYGQFNSSGDASINNQASASLLFATANTERMRINSSGNVGIKTSSPIGTLDVHDGTFVLSKPSSNSSSRNWRFLPDNAAAGNLGLQVSTAAGGSTFSNVVEINSSGNVGINQTNPNKAKLHVVGDNTDGDIIAKFKSGSGNANSTAFIALVTGYPDTANDLEGHAYIGVQRSGSGNQTKILFKTYSGDSGAMRTRMTIEPNNNVDIQGKIHTQLGTQINSFNKETTGDQIRFNTTGTTRGSISSNGSTVAFNTSASDRSMKKNFENWTEDTLALFKNINPQKFNFLDQEDGTNKEKGFIAQDMVASFPEAYIKNDDDKYMFNASGMVVYLMKAIQELEAEVAALKAS